MPIERNVDGYSSLESFSPLGAFPRPAPWTYSVLWEDFLAFNTSTLPGWTNTATNGTLTIAGGNAVLTMGGADNDTSHFYTTIAQFALVATKKFFVRTRVKIQKGASGTIGQEEFFFGLTGVQTTTNFINAGGTARTFDDGLGFISYDASTSIAATVVKDDVESVASAVGTYADDTWMVLEIDYDGSTIRFYKDGTQVASFSNTNFPTDAVGPAYWIKAGGAHAKVLLIDYCFVAVEK